MKLNRIWSIFTMLVLVLGAATILSSCKKDEVVETPTNKPEPSTLAVSTRSLDFTASGGDKSFTVSSNTSWNINGAKNWCYVNITQSSGTKQVNVEVEKNTTQETRTCRLTVSTTDGLTQDVTIKQEAAETTVSVSPSEITFNGESGLKDEFTITTNGKWTISGKPDWLNVPTSGEGETKCKIETTEANDTDEDRTVELKISAGGKTVKLRVTQKALRVKCYVEPSNLVALYNEIAFDLKATGNIFNFKYMVFSKSEVDGKLITEKQIEAKLMEAEDNTYAQDNVLLPTYYYSYDGYYYKFTENTSYYIYTLTFDMNNNIGGLKRAEIRTLKEYDYDYDAFVDFSDIYYGDGGFVFTCTKDGMCDSYHLICGNLPSGFEKYPNVLYAFAINYYIKHKTHHHFSKTFGLDIYTNYPNNHSFTYVTTSLSERPVIFAKAWGVYKDGSLSSFISGFCADITQLGNAPVKSTRSLRTSKTRERCENLSNSAYIAHTNK